MLTSHAPSLRPLSGSSSPAMSRAPPRYCDAFSRREEVTTANGATPRDTWMDRAVNKMDHKAVEVRDVRATRYGEGMPRPMLNS